MSTPPPGRVPAAPRGSGSRSACLAEGLVAGTLLGSLDWVATGLGRVPPSLLGLILAWGVLVGLLAGLVAALSGRRGVALGLVVFGACALHAGSTCTKSLRDSLADAEGRIAAVALVILAVVAGVVSARRHARGRGWAWPVTVLASVPGASLLWGGVPQTPLWLVLTCSLPLLAGVAWSLPSPAWSGRVVAAIAIVGLATPSFVAEAHRIRHHPPAPVRARVPDEAPDIVLVVIDTLRWDHAFPPAPQRPGPTLEHLTRVGVRFDQAVASAPWTLPSMASLLTSLHPSQHGAVTAEQRLPEDVDTLAERLHAAGYETVAFTGGAFVSPAYGLGQGFEVFEPHAEYNPLPFRGHIPFVWRLVKNRWVPLGVVLRHVRDFGEYVGVPRLRERVEDWLERREASRPFFLLVHTYQVHDYYIYQPAPDALLHAERGGPPPQVGWKPWVHPSELVTGTQEQLDWYHDVYRRRIEYVDRELGPLLERLEAASGERGLVGVLTSDHGEGFDVARGRVHHGGRLHEDLLRVPLVLWAPGRLAPGRRIDEQVRLVDVLPTLMELAGLALPDGLAGESLLPLLAGQQKESRLAWSESHAEVHLVSLRAPPWKLVQGRQGEELFRLDTDPLEDRPRVEPLPTELVGPWADRAELLAPRTGVESHQDAATIERLRQIGY